jgi:hypothetical protein
MQATPPGLRGRGCGLVCQALTGRRTPVPAARESLGYELAAVAGEGGFEPSELVVPSVLEESTEPPDNPD